MARKSSILTLRVPEALKHKIGGRAYFAKFWKGKSRKEILRAFDAVMAKVKKGKVPAWDAL